MHLTLSTLTMPTMRPARRSGHPPFPPSPRPHLSSSRLSLARSAMRPPCTHHAPCQALDAGSVDDISVVVNIYDWAPDASLIDDTVTATVTLSATATATGTAADSDAEV